MVYFINLFLFLIPISLALDESSFFEIPNAKRALPFVIAYRKKGAQGGEKVSEIFNRTPPRLNSSLHLICSLVTFTDDRVQEKIRLILNSESNIES